MLKIFPTRDHSSGVKKNVLKPWKQEGWVIPPLSDGDFVAHMEMVLDVYKQPYDPLYPVVCMDESPKQLIADCRCKKTSASKTVSTCPI